MWHRVTTTLAPASWAAYCCQILYLLYKSASWSLSYKLHRFTIHIISRVHLDSESWYAAHTCVWIVQLNENIHKHFQISCRQTNACESRRYSKRHKRKVHRQSIEHFTNSLASEHNKTVWTLILTLFVQFCAGIGDNGLRREQCSELTRYLGGQKKWDNIASPVLMCHLSTLELFPAFFSSFKTINIRDKDAECSSSSFQRPDGSDGPVID